MDNCQLNAITGYYKIPVTLYQEAGAEQKKKKIVYIYIRLQTFGKYRVQSQILANKHNKPKSIYEKN